MEQSGGRLAKLRSVTLNSTEQNPRFQRNSRSPVAAWLLNGLHNTPGIKA